MLIRCRRIRLSSSESSIIAIAFKSALHFGWSFACTHCSRMHPGTDKGIDLVHLYKKPRPSGVRYRFANRWTHARLRASTSTSSSSANGS
jgi:hypothetical protein